MTKLVDSDIHKVARFLIAGVLNTLFGFAVYTSLTFINLPTWMTVSFSMIAALGFNYLTYGGIAFRNLSRRNLPRFIVFYVVVAILNTAALDVLTAQSFNPIAAQALLIVPLAIFSYIGMARYVFRR